MPLRVDASRPLTQGEGARWHCAARREIAERSEEAPEAKAAQPSCNVGSWKTPAGCFGGDARGAEKGAQPHNRPRLAARRAGGQNQRKEKSPCPQGTNNNSQRTDPVSMPLAARRADRQNSQKKLPCPQARKPLFKGQAITDFACCCSLYFKTPTWPAGCLSHPLFCPYTPARRGQRTGAAFGRA